jgi:putative transposase
MISRPGLPPWRDGYFWRWGNSGDWKRIHDKLRAQLRQQESRHKHPKAGCLDSQSVKTTQVPGIRGFDAGKNVNGCKRHVLVDTLGLLLAVVVTPLRFLIPPPGWRSIAF